LRGRQIRVTQEPRATCPTLRVRPHGVRTWGSRDSGEGVKSAPVRSDYRVLRCVIRHGVDLDYLQADSCVHLRARVIQHEDVHSYGRPHKSRQRQSKLYS